MIKKNKLVNKEFNLVYSEKKFFKKILKNAKRAGLNVIYIALILYYTLKKPTTPSWAKAQIIAALAYFISPIDAIIDVTPVIGYADDLGILLLALFAVSMYVSEETKNQAKKKLRDIFGDYDHSQLDEIDKKIKN